MKVLFIDTVHPLLKKSLDEAGFSCEDGSLWTREEILKQISGFQGVVIRSRVFMDKEILDRAAQLKFIARAGAGMENIDVTHAASRKILCLNAPEGNRDAVGEHAVAMLLGLFTNLCKADREVREGKWNRESNRGVELQGKTVGLIGYGNTGRAFAKKLSGFDCRVLAYDKYLGKFTGEWAQEATMDRIFTETEVLSLHIPLTAETEGLVNDDYINRFDKRIYIVNTSRGRCLKTDDLVKNLQTGKVLGACLDVIDFEDTSFEKFHVDKNENWNYLHASGKVILSPHIAGWTHESNEKIARILFEKINQAFRTH